MNIDVVKTVESSLQSIQDWKPYGMEWHRNKKGQFETNFKKNIKQMINFNYQGMELTGKDFVLILGKGYTSVDGIATQFHQFEMMNLEKTKLYYSKKIQGRNTMEKGDAATIDSLLAKFSSPYFYLVQIPDKKRDFSALVFAKSANTK